MGELSSDSKTVPPSNFQPRVHQEISVAVSRNSLRKNNLRKASQEKNNNLDLFPKLYAPFWGTVIFSYKRKQNLNEHTARFISFPVPLPQFTIWPEFFASTFMIKQETCLQSSFVARNLKKEPRSSTNKKDQLPNSDFAKLVLARVQFLVENEDVALPKYHVFYSNSECIAVWCKTGRWSTLQAAVFLHSTAVGNAKQT